jgi:hypothetical protein
MSAANSAPAIINDRAVPTNLGLCGFLGFGLTIQKLRKRLAA